jgi:hypothetical protein
MSQFGTPTQNIPELGISENKARLALGTVSRVARVWTAALGSNGSRLALATRGHYRVP